jgi:hypothetical protein
MAFRSERKILPAFGAILMCDPATGALIATTLFSAGATKVTSDKQQRSAERLQTKRLEKQSELARRKRIAEVGAMEKERVGEQKSSLLAKAGAQQIRNIQLQQRGIAPRRMGGFADITKSVLDEGVG